MNQSIYKFNSTAHYSFMFETQPKAENELYVLSRVNTDVLHTGFTVHSLDVSSNGLT
jgi:ribosomal protein S6